ncbi:SUKH-3 domain-containing protein [Chitinivorax sp. B]|uniref:SUKH-3 domain-containing protein n=1 Tax=Chitinivorax sp. B TaxID=2502235 RepID=UPI0010F948AD|nr:SUKH-3 domain-containing protein [Chitinivorax sp. B]
MKYSVIIENSLISTGWFPGRRVDVEGVIGKLKNEGYPAGSAVKVFLEEFGGLSGMHKGYRGDDWEEFHFDPIIAMEGIFRERVIDYELRFGDGLTPIGEAYNQHLVLLISEKGAMLGAYDDYLCVLGESVEIGFQALFESKDGVDVP